MSTLYRKYRPKTFSEVVGQAHIIRTLSNAIKNDRIGQAYLLTGPRGTGKTTIARIFAKTINCTNQQAPKDQNVIVSVEPCNKCNNCQLVLENRAIDLVEIDAASHTGVDNIRQLRQAIPLPPSALKFKVYIIDEVHMLSTGAFNALLKTLEEPPAHAIFILATTELHKVPETIISRCQRFDITRLTMQQIIERLSQIAKSENVEVDDEALEAIAIEAEGGMRDAESLLGQIIALEDETISAKEVHEILGTSSKKLVIDFASNLVSHNQVACLDQIDTMQSDGINLKNFNKMLLSFWRTLLLMKTNPNHADLSVALSKEQLESARTLAHQSDISQIVRLIELFQKSLEQFKETTIPQLPLELATIEFHLESAPGRQINKPEAPSSPSNGLAQKSKGAHNETDAQKGQDRTVPEAKSKPGVVGQIKNPPAQSKIRLEDVLDSWSEILEKVKPHNHSIHAFLKNCTPCGVAQGTVYIKTKYDFYRDKLSEVNNLLTVKKAVATISDATLNVKFITQKECDNMDFDKNDDKKAKKHNILHDAMQVFGGRIVK